MIHLYHIHLFYIINISIIWYQKIEDNYNTNNLFIFYSNYKEYKEIKFVIFKKVEAETSFELSDKNKNMIIIPKNNL